jgi:chaperonin GroES
MSQIQPLNDRIVVTKTEADDVTKGGLFIPETGKERPQQGLVIAVGSGKVIGNSLVPLDIKIGDTVLFGKYSGTDITVDGVELLILREEDVFGRLI